MSSRKPIVSLYPSGHRASVPEACPLLTFAVGSERRIGGRRLLVMAWEAHAQHRFAGSRIDGDLTVVTLDDDAARDVQTEPGPLADVLGRVERIERTGLHVRRHPGTGVRHLDDHAVTLGARRHPKRAM